MRLLFLLTMLFAAGCAHEQTTMDRELALKLADRPQVVVAPSAPVNVNIGSAPVQAQQPHQVCNTTPLYNLDGSFWKNDTQCF